MRKAMVSMMFFVGAVMTANFLDERHDVKIIDTPKHKIAVAVESLPFTDKHKNHAENIEHIMGRDDTEVYKINIFDDREYVNTLKKLRSTRFKVINISLQSCDYLTSERMAIQSLINAGKIVVVAAGNKDYQCSPVYPASYNIPGMIVVGSPNGQRNNVSLTIRNDRHCASIDNCQSGTSQAAAKVSRMAIDMLKQGMTTRQVIDELSKRKRAD